MESLYWILENKDILDSFESIIFSFALLIAGAWTAFNFKALRMNSRAKLEEIRLRKELENQAVVNIDVSGSHLNNPSKEFLIQVNAVIINKGSRNVLLNFEDFDPFRISHLTFEDDGRKSFNDLKFDKIWGISALENRVDSIKHNILRSSSRVAYSTIFFVSKPGIYLLEFAVNVSPEDKAIAKEFRAYGEDFSWRGRTYLFVSNQNIG